MQRARTALVSSPRGVDTVADVQSPKVYLRDKVGKLGVAPLTSMFLFGAEPAVTGDQLPS